MRLDFLSRFWSLDHPDYIRNVRVIFVYDSGLWVNKYHHWYYIIYQCLVWVSNTVVCKW